VVGAQIGPAVAGAHVPVGGAAERWLGAERARVGGVVRRHGIADADATIVVAGIRQRRVGQHIEPVRAAGERLERHVDEHRRARRIGHVRLADAPAPGARGVHLAIGQAARVGELGAVHRVVGLALSERPAVGDDELQITQARRPKIGCVDLAQLAAREREPRLPGRRGRGPEPVLVAARPVRHRPRRPRRARCPPRRFRRRWNQRSAHRDHYGNRPNPHVLPPGTAVPGKRRDERATESLHSQEPCPTI
jgi:hypothetical protein